MTEQTENVWDQLLDAAVALDGLLVRCLRGDNFEYTGTPELAERFHKAVIEALHVRTG